MAEQMRRLWDPVLKARAHVKQKASSGSGGAASTGSGAVPGDSAVDGRSRRTRSTIVSARDPKHVPSKNEGVSDCVSSSWTLIGRSRSLRWKLDKPSL